MIDEDVSRRTIALSMRTGKLTARVLAYVFRETSGDCIRLPGLEEQQIFVRPGLVKGIVNIPLPGHPVKFFWGPKIFALPQLSIREQMAAYKEVIDRFPPASDRAHPEPGRELSSIVSVLVVLKCAHTR